MGLIAAVPAAAHAADATDAAVSTSAPTPVSPVVVTAVEHAPLTATFTESTVPRAEIERLSPSPTLTVETLLNSQPSIFAYTDGPFGVRTNIYFRAFNSGQFSQTYDGIALNDVFNSAVTGGAENVNNILLQTQDIDSVQVYRGVNNPSVNSYDLLGGTINFLPKQPDEQQGAEGELSYGSFNTFQAHATFDTGDFHGLTQRATFSYGSTDGWQQNTSDWNYNFYYALNYTPVEGQTLRFFSVLNHNQGFPPDNIPLPLLQLNGFNYQFPQSVHEHAIHNTNWLGILDYAVDVNPAVVFDNKLYAGWDSYKRTSFTDPAAENAPFPGSGGVGYFLDDGPTFPFWLPQFSPNYTQGPTYDPGTTFGTGVFDYGAGEKYHFYGYETWGYGDTPTLSLNLPRNKIVIGGNATWGGLWSREYWWGTPNMPMVSGFNNAWDEWDTRIFASVYGQDEIAVIPDTLFVTPGVKYLYAHTSDKDHVGFFYPITGTVSDNEDYVSPTVGVSYKPIKTVDIYGAFGQNLKFPDISAYYNGFQTDFNGNNIIVPVTIKPEYVNDYELGARFESGGFFASLDLYREDFSNTFITLPNLTNGTPNGTTRPGNGGSSVYQGVELQLKENIHWMDADWSGYFNYAHNQAKFTSAFTDQSTGNTVLAGTPVADVPQDLISTGVNWSREGWAANLDLRYVGRQFTDQNQLGTSPTPNTIPAYVVVNLGASKTFRVEEMGHSGSVKLAINVDNLFDERYYNEAFTDTDNLGNSFLRPVVGPPLGVTGSVTARF